MKKFFLAYWSSEGFESITDITEYVPPAWDKIRVEAILRDKKEPTNPLNNTISSMIMRARANSHRHYEIYSFSVDNSVPLKDVIEWSTHSPQSLVDLIRDRGFEIFSNRQSSAPVIL